MIFPTSIMKKNQLKPIITSSQKIKVKWHKIIHSTVISISKSLSKMIIMSMLQKILQKDMAVVMKFLRSFASNMKSWKIYLLKKVCHHTVKSMIRKNFMGILNLHFQARYILKKVIKSKRALLLLQKWAIRMFNRFI